MKKSAIQSLILTEGELEQAILDTMNKKDFLVGQHGIKQIAHSIAEFQKAKLNGEVKTKGKE